MCGYRYWQRVSDSMDSDQVVQRFARSESRSASEPDRRSASAHERSALRQPDRGDRRTDRRVHGSRPSAVGLDGRAAHWPARRAEKMQLRSRRRAASAHPTVTCDRHEMGRQRRSQLDTALKTSRARQQSLAGSRPREFRELDCSVRDLPCVWAEKDLNLRRHTPAELQSASFGRSDTDPGLRTTDVPTRGRIR